MSDVAASAALSVSSAPPASPAAEHLGRSMWSHGSFSFKDLLDVINPLQHLPVIGSIYRYLTGDEPSVGTRVIGDALYGGPIGFGASIVSNALLTSDNGQDLGERLLAHVFGPRDHDSSPTLGTPQVAADNPPSTQAPLPEWMASAGTPDGQPRTPAPANQQNGATHVASVTLPSKLSASAAPLAARSIASASAPLAASAAPPAAGGQSSIQGLAPIPAQPVAVNQLFRSAPPAPGTPEQAFAAQASQFQRQISQGRGANGAVLNNRPVPLQLSGNLLPVMPSGGHLAVAPSSTPAPSQANAPAVEPPSGGPPANPAASQKPEQNAIAQKMMDALNKYEQLKRLEQQQDSAEKADQAKLDLAL